MRVHGTGVTHHGGDLGELTRETAWIVQKLDQLGPNAIYPDEIGKLRCLVRQADRLLGKFRQLSPGLTTSFVCSESGIEQLLYDAPTPTADLFCTLFHAVCGASQRALHGRARSLEEDQQRQEKVLILPGGSAYGDE